MNIILRVNGREVAEEARIILPSLYFSWDIVGEYFITPTSSGLISNVRSITQKSFDLRVGFSIDDIGTSSFVGDILSTQQNTTERIYKYYSDNIIRGGYYFGQIKVQDELDRYSDWKTFFINYKNAPDLDYISLTPSSPTVFDNLKLSIFENSTEYNEVTKYNVYWFKNDILQKELQNILTINSIYTNYGDVWRAEVIPYDSFETGDRYVSDSVDITQNSAVASNVKIYPETPNENDILKAEYSLSDDLFKDFSITWYINGESVLLTSESIYARINVVEGDYVYYEVQPKNNNVLGSVYKSNTVIISNPGYYIKNIRINGILNSNETSSKTPNISWDYISRFDKIPYYLNIKIGSFYGSSDIYENTIYNPKDNFSVPIGLLTSGKDYYISISLSDTTKFNKYYYHKFSIKGNRWEASVDNDLGWIFSSNFAVEQSDLTSEDHLAYTFYDGSKCIEVLLKNNKITVISDSITDISEIEYNNSVNNIIISVKGTDIKIFLNSNIIFEDDSFVTKVSLEKKILIGGQGESSSKFTTYAIKYNTDSNYDNNILNSSFYNNKNYVKYENTDNTEISSLAFYGNNLYASVNYLQKNKSEILKFDRSKGINNFYATPRTLSPIYNISQSPDREYTFLSHISGFSYIKSYLLENWSYQIDFTKRDAPKKLVEDWQDFSGVPLNILEVTNVGLEINTNFVNIDTDTI